MKPANTKQIAIIRKGIARFLTPKGIKVSIDNGFEFITIYPDTRKNTSFEGLQITWFFNEGIFEFSEYMAGINENELHIFSVNNSLNACLRSFLKGKRQAVKIYQ